ncbi:MAG: glycosyltransferase family 2 protein [Fibrobacteraceae bacterium]|nr:glycosyltransferase family 2 protein [Fibrobacteraceae bacterium]
MTSPINLAIIVPCYNEEEVLPDTAKILSAKRQQLINEKRLSETSRIVFVDDGSKDSTWAKIQQLHSENPSAFSGIKLSRNRGHQNALLCGLMTVKDTTDATISIDADLQDDVDAIDDMVKKYQDGCEIVYGIRSNRDSDSIFKRSSAQGFYKLMKFLGADIVYNHADFRLMGTRALDALAEYKEVNLFLRGIVPMLGYKTGTVIYARKKRKAGESKYPLSKMLKFAFEGISSLSVKPLRIITILGILIFSTSFFMIIYFFVRYFTGDTVAGWPSLICSIWGIGGLILFAVGIVGEYIGKIYLEAKARPRFFIEAVLK